MTDFEERASVALHEVVPVRTSRPDLFEQVSRRVARRQRKRGWTAAGTALAAIGVTVGFAVLAQARSNDAAGGAVGVGADSSAPSTDVVAAPRCPDAVPETLPKPGGHFVGAQLVPGAPAVATACRYYGLNGSHHVGTLAGSVAIREDLGAWVSTFNSGHRVADGNYSCPMDTAGRYLVLFAYQKDLTVTVQVNATGCRWATNGALTLTAAGLPLLEDALGSDVVANPKES